MRATLETERTERNERWRTESLRRRLGWHGQPEEMDAAAHWRRHENLGVPHGHDTSLPTDLDLTPQTSSAIHYVISARGVRWRTALLEPDLAIRSVESGFERWLDG